MYKGRTEAGVWIPTPRFVPEEFKRVGMQGITARFGNAINRGPAELAVLGIEALGKNPEFGNGIEIRDNCRPHINALFDVTAVHEKAVGRSGANTGWKHRMAGKGRIENLRPPWKPGESGNPGGRPRKRPISQRYEEIVEVPLSERERKRLGLWQGATWGDAIALSQARAAVNGRTDAAREIREAIEGKATQRVEMAGKEETPANVSIVPDSRTRVIDCLYRRLRADLGGPEVPRDAANDS
jgi:Family of unknown function (DUF5681)